MPEGARRLSDGRAAPRGRGASARETNAPRVFPFPARHGSDGRLRHVRVPPCVARLARPVSPRNRRPTRFSASTAASVLRPRLRHLVQDQPKERDGDHGREGPNEQPNGASQQFPPHVTAVLHVVRDDPDAYPAAAFIRHRRSPSCNVEGPAWSLARGPPAATPPSRCADRTGPRLQAYRLGASSRSTSASSSRAAVWVGCWAITVRSSRRASRTRPWSYRSCAIRPATRPTQALAAGVPRKPRRLRPAGRRPSREWP